MRLVFGKEEYTGKGKESRVSRTVEDDRGGEVFPLETPPGARVKAIRARGVSLRRQLKQFGKIDGRKKPRVSAAGCDFRNLRGFGRNLPNIEDR